MVNVRMVVLVGLVAVAVLVVASFAGLLQIGVSADTDTVGVSGCGIGGEDAIGGGQFRDLPGDARTNGELASSTRLFYAWFLDGESRPLSIAGKLTKCGALGVGNPEGVYYRFLYADGGAGFVGFTNDRLPSGALRLIGGGGGFAASEWNAPAMELILDGYTFRPCSFPADANPSEFYVSKESLTCTPEAANRTMRDGAILRVEMFTFQLTQLEGEGFHRLFAWDEIELRSAIPEVAWGQRAYRIGETATVAWDIPTVSDEAGKPLYFLSVLNLNTNTAMAGFDRKPIVSTTGSVSIPVTESLFSSETGTCQNRLRALIYTQVIRADQADASVQAPFDAVLGGGEPPSVTRVAFNKPEYFEGDTVVVTYAASGQVTKYHVTAHIGGLVPFDKDVTETSVTFVAPRTGILEVEVTAYNGCQPSEVRKETTTVGNVLPDYCQAFPQHPACAGARFDFVQLFLGLLLIAIGLALLVFVRVNMAFLVLSFIVIIIGALLLSLAILDFVSDLGPLVTAWHVS